MHREHMPRMHRRGSVQVHRVAQHQQLGSARLPLVYLTLSLLTLVVAQDFTVQVSGQQSQWNGAEIGSALDPFERAGLWNSPACRNFYRDDGEEHEGENTLVWENFREIAGSKEPFGSPIIYCREAKLVYVDNVKAGSSTISSILNRHLNCTARSHPEWAPADIRAARCSGVSDEECDFKRSRTDWLDERTIAGMVFFSVVREPIARFKSGFKQAVSVPASEHHGWTLQQYLELYRVDSINEHTHTQARSLSGRDANGKQVPMHFIASLENLEHDMAILWSQLGLPPLARFPHARAAERDPSKAVLDTDLTDGQLRELCDHLAQDFACFGYALPPECRR